MEDIALSRTWDDLTPLGVHRLDEQRGHWHMAFFRLQEALDDDPRGALAEYRFLMLFEMTLEYFQMEEAFLHQVGYPDLARHRGEHGKISELFRGSLYRRDAPGTPPLVDLVRIFTESTLHHFETSDRSCALWLQAKPKVGSAGSPDQLE